mgnify:FL=1
MKLVSNSLNLTHFALFLILSVGGIMSSCSDDEKSEPPVITYPDNGMLWEVKTGELLPFEFTVVAEGGYASHSLEGVAGTIIADQTEIPDGTKNFRIKGGFFAGDVPGPGAIKLTVRDNEGAQSSSTIGVDILRD